MDLILSTFAQSRLSQLNDRQLREYDRVRSSSSLFSQLDMERWFTDERGGGKTVLDFTGLDYLLLCYGKSRGSGTLEE